MTKQINFYDMAEYHQKVRDMFILYKLSTNFQHLYILYTITDNQIYSDLIFQ